MKIQGGAYVFKTGLSYCQQFNRQPVVVISAGTMVSLVETEEGKRFAAFNSELSRDTRDMEPEDRMHELPSVWRRN